MTELLWQSTLLLALAFFFGAVFACGLKRRYWYGPPTKKSAVAVSGVSHAPAPDQPKIEVAPRAAPEGERFGRAISGQSAPSAAAAPAPKPAVASMAAAMSAPAAAPKPVPAPAAAPAPQPAAPAPSGSASSGCRSCRRSAAARRRPSRAAHFEHLRIDGHRRAGEAGRRWRRSQR